MSHLRDLQLRFQDYLIDGSEAIEADIVSTANALAEHRLGTYYNAYRIRLIDALATDFSALQQYLGREAFENLILDYLHHYPSTQPSVRWVGRHLTEYLQQHYNAEDAEFLRELASTSGPRQACSTPPPVSSWCNLKTWRRCLRKPGPSSASLSNRR